MFLTAILFILTGCQNVDPEPVTATPDLPAYAAETPTVVTPSTPEQTTASFSLEKSDQEFTSRETYQIGLGDLDGDGDLDAVFANPQRNVAQVWLNNGDGRFTDTGQKLTQYGHGVGLADFDADGDLDAFIVCHQFVAPSKVYLNDGAALFVDTGQDFGDAKDSAAGVNLLDINGDGHIDAHVVYFSFEGLPDKVFLNDGAANFTDSGLLLEEDAITWGDLDGDGDVDYFGKRWGEGYVAQLNDGNGRFGSAWQMDDDQSTVGDTALADFDNDGDLDVLVTNGFRDTGSFPSRLFWNDSTGSFTDSGQNLNETMAAELAVGDLDNDGDIDAFIANMDRPNEIWLNDGSGNLIDAGLRLGANTDMNGKPSLGDLDRDGDLDVLVGRFQGGAEVWLNTAVPPVPKPMLFNSPTIDGVLSPNEWENAETTFLSDGSELLLMQDGGYFYLGIRSITPEMIGSNVFVANGEQVRILHTSAALGTAVYQQNASSWQQTQNFDWQCRDTGSSETAQAERAAHLQANGWLAANSRMGTPSELEYQIKLPEATYRIAVSVFRSSAPDERIMWPPDLTDATAQPNPAGLPAKMEFALDQWATFQEE
ncbi:MAG: VCBS repeat-containing protein [Ardenticatenaceae bacterium]|nr:VCBS repeat-containing protein [Ardenticatenaceae bacterium]